MGPQEGQHTFSLVNDGHSIHKTQQSAFVQKKVMLSSLFIIHKCFWILPYIVTGGIKPYYLITKILLNIS